jgi:hypothetical protein
MTEPHYIQNGGGRSHAEQVATRQASLETTEQLIYLLIKSYLLQMRLV